MIAALPRSGRRWWAALAVGIVGVLAFYAVPVPAFDRPVSTVLLDREGALLGASIATDEQWRFPHDAEVPERFALAITTYEDKRFWRHPGVDPLAVLRALWLDLRAGEVVSGGSTLTMQVVRLSRDDPARTVPEKLREMVLALRLERAASKDEVLALYATHAPFGGNTVGLQAASWRYFGRPATDLSWGEAATLAVLPNSPALVHPGRNRTALRTKRDALLDDLVRVGLLDENDAALAKLESLPAAPRAVPQRAPHLLVRAKSRDGQTRVHTTLDGRVQDRVTELVWHHNERLAANQVHNAAVVVLDTDSGATLAYVGNVPEFRRAAHHNHVDIVRAARSTGSTLKPFLYTGLVADGLLLPDALVPDVPLRVGGFAPENFDRVFEGALPASEALARSRNVPATWMLQQYTVDAFYGLLRRHGMSTLHRDASDYGLALILGGAEGSLWDLTSMYRQLGWAAANPGGAHFAAPHWRLASSGRAPDLARWDAGAAYTTLQALREVNRPGSRSGWRQYDSSTPVAWKTGTSFGFRDGWAIGVTPGVTVGVWVGNADGEARPGLTGVQAAAPLMFDILDGLDTGGWFAAPNDALVDIEVCAQSGLRAGPDCAETRVASVPRAGRHGGACSHCVRIHCDVGCEHRVHAGCSTVAERVPTSWFSLPPTQEHYYARRHADHRPLPPWRADCVPDDDVQSPLAIVQPRPNARVVVPIELDGQRGRLVLQAAHRDRGTPVHWHLDGAYLDTTRDPHELSVAPAAGEHVLTLVDARGARVERHFQVLAASGRH